MNTLTARGLLVYVDLFFLLRKGSVERILVTTCISFAELDPWIYVVEVVYFV